MKINRAFWLHPPPKEAAGRLVGTPLKRRDALDLLVQPADALRRPAVLCLGRLQLLRRRSGNEPGGKGEAPAR